MIEFAGEYSKDYLVRQEVKEIMRRLMEEIKSPKVLLNDEIDIRFHAHNSYLSLQSSEPNDMGEYAEYVLSLHTDRNNDYITDMNVQWNFAFMPLHESPLFRIDCGTGAYHHDKILHEIFDEGHIHLTDENGIQYSLTIQESLDSDIIQTIVDVSLDDYSADLPLIDVLTSVLEELNVDSDDIDNLEMGFRYGLTSGE